MHTSPTTELYLLVHFILRLSRYDSIAFNRSNPNFNRPGPAPSSAPTLKSSSPLLCIKMKTNQLLLESPVLQFHWVIVRLMMRLLSSVFQVILEICSDGLRNFWISMNSKK